MKNLYSEESVNFVRLKTDRFFTDYRNKFSYDGIIDKTYRFVEQFQLYDVELWARFVTQFKESTDDDSGWRGEYWGKMMRGACFVYSYTQNEKLYEILKDTVSNMMSAENDGRVSSYPIDKEFTGWDLWCRKYVILGMEYFLEICNDCEFEEKIIKFISRQADYICDRIGDDGKICITHTSYAWRGLNSSSILEPMVRLYSLTKDEKYLKFASYIISEGCIDTGNIFEYAYENGLYPYQYPVTKAYETISCFEGLLEYYRITGEEKYRTAVVNFADKILESDFTVIGSCGCTHELFDHSTVRQANTTNGELAQETCVTVTLMKFLYQVHLLTGDVKYADAFEISLYNAYLGAVNTEKSLCKRTFEENPDLRRDPMPFDSYSPLTADRRGKAVGGFKIMKDGTYYGCCACIGSAGIGLVSKIHILTTPEGFAVNLFIPGEVKTLSPLEKEVVFKTETAYPSDNKVSITVETSSSETFEVLLRCPKWSKNTEAKINGKKVCTADGYARIYREWSGCDKIEMEFDMSTYAVFPPVYNEQVIMTNVVADRNGDTVNIPTYDRQDPHALKSLALRRGPLMLAQDENLGCTPDIPADIKISSDNTIDVLPDKSDTAMLRVSVPLKDGSFMPLSDYASAGKDWNKKIAVWIKTK